LRGGGLTEEWWAGLGHALEQCDRERADLFELVEGVWTKPSSHTKQKREHRVPLSAPVRQLLAEMRAAADRRAAGANREPSPFLFQAQRRGRGARNGRGHLAEIIKTRFAVLTWAEGINAAATLSIMGVLLANIIHPGAARFGRRKPGFPTLARRAAKST
jgi:hypothetical protein